MAVQRTNFKVLVVDDHFMARQMIGNALKNSNVFDITMVSNGEEAIAAITSAHAAKTPFHIVFLDWEMPGVSGFEVLNYFRSRKEYAATAFVMLTAMTQQTDVMQAIRAGATSYIAKPVSGTRIEEKFAEICDWVRKQEDKKA
jgi:CheY-like chemotaxis protein